MSAEQPAECSDQENTPDERKTSSQRSGRLSLGLGMGVLSAVAGGVLAWVALAAYYPVFKIPTEISDLAHSSVTSEQSAQLDAEFAKVRRQNTMFALALLAATIGGSLGVAEGGARRSCRAVLVGAMVPTLIGGIVGSAAGLLGDLVWVNAKPFAEPMPLTGTVLVQLVAMATLGAGVGLGLGASTGSVRTAATCLSAGLLAGIGAGLLYPLIVGFALPGAQTERLVPTSHGAMLLWVALAAGLQGLGLPGTAARRRPTPASPARVSGDEAV